MVKFYVKIDLNNILKESTMVNPTRPGGNTPAPTTTATEQTQALENKQPDSSVGEPVAKHKEAGLDTEGKALSDMSVSADPVETMSLEEVGDHPMTAILANLDTAGLKAMYLTHKASKEIIDHAMQPDLKLDMENDDPNTKNIAAIRHTIAMSKIDDQLQDLKEKTGTEDTIEEMRTNLSFDHFIREDGNPDYFGFLKHLEDFQKSIMNQNGLPSCTLKEAYEAYKECRQLINDHQASNTYFSFSEKKLTMLPPEIGTLTYLDYLLLSRNNLHTLPPEISQLSQLTYINVSENKITSLPREMGQLKNIRILYVQNNQLESLLPEIGLCTKLEFLDISNNVIYELPAEVGKLLRLVTFLASNNRHIVSLPSEFKNLTNLRGINLSENLLDGIPEEILSLSKLEILDIHTNQITDLPPEFKNLQHLTDLNISNNFLSYSPNLVSTLNEIPRLEDINIRNNDFTNEEKAEIRDAINVGIELIL